MPIKRGIRQLHLILGLLSGLVVFVVGSTGSIYAFEEEIRSLLYKNLRFLEVSSTSQKPLGELIGLVKAQYPTQRIKSIRVKTDPLRSLAITLKNRQTIYINPYTGKLLGNINQEKDFFAVVLKIHRTLYLGEAGKIITGISATIFVLMLISGIILWWPKKKRIVKQKLTIMYEARWRRLNFDLHSVLGFYASWIIIFTALTGVVWSFKYPIDSMFAGAAALYPPGKEYFINFPEDSTGAVRILIRYDNKGFYRKQSQLFFDQYNGSLLKSQLHDKTSSGDKLKATLYDIHTGKILGPAGQFFVFLASFITASLPVTGFMIWWNRRKLKRSY
jgi:uncharacterized iron-regulated membrane protein